MTDPLDLHRRTLLAGIAALVGAAALPAEALAAPAAGAKRFLDKPRFALLGAVADTIMPATDTPGALAAEVPARLDGLLANWASAKTRAVLTGALERIDAEARAQKGKPFAALPAADREAVLRPHDLAALAKVPPPADAPPANPYNQGSWVANPGYLALKGLVLGLYYYSPVATETELPYEHVPGKWQPSVKLTPTSRPFLGNGPF